MTNLRKVDLELHNLCDTFALEGAYEISLAEELHDDHDSSFDDKYVFLSRLLRVGLELRLQMAVNSKALRNPLAFPVAIEARVDDVMSIPLNRGPNLQLSIELQTKLGRTGVGEWDSSYMLHLENQVNEEVVCYDV
jgi:hypothetical protein